MSAKPISVGFLECQMGWCWWFSGWGRKGVIGGEEITRIAQVFRGCIFLSSRGLLVKIGLPYTLCSGVSLVLPDSLERSQTGMRSLNALAVRASSTPILREGKHTTPLILLGGSENGAGDGNRTHVASLEGWSSTIELHPHKHHGIGSRPVVNELVWDWRTWLAFWGATFLA